jgi:hypothetical protein
MIGGYFDSHRGHFDAPLVVEDADFLASNICSGVCDEG